MAARRVAAGRGAASVNVQAAAAVPGRQVLISRPARLLSHGYGRAHTIGKDQAVAEALVIFDADGT